MSDAPPTRLMLVTPELADTEAFAPAFAAALAAGDVVAAVIRLAPADDRTRLARAKALIAAAQEHGAAALIAGDAVEDLLGKSGADGIHLFGEAGVADAAERFHPSKVVGCAASRSRDGAMSAGDAGADYVLFGLDPQAPWPAEATRERVEWWVPIFETPAVGFAAALDDVSILAAARVEFVALGDAIWRHPEGPAAAVAQAERLLSLARAPSP